MSDFSKMLFDMGVSLVRAQAEADRNEKYEAEYFNCKGCGRRSVGTGDFPYHSWECRMLHTAVVSDRVQ